MVPPLYTGASGSFLSSWALRDGSPGERAALQNETVRTHPDAGMPRTNMVSSVHVHHPQALLCPEHPPIQAQHRPHSFSAQKFSLVFKRSRIVSEEEESEVCL